MPRKAASKPQRGEGIDERLLLAATDVFLEKGFSAATVEEIAVRANASKITFYSHFGNKEQLFHAVAKRFNQRILANFTSALGADVPVQKGLSSFAHILIEVLLNADAVRFLRVLQVEADRFPGLAVVFDESGPAKGRGLLCAFLKAHMNQGSLRKANAATAAEQFIHMAMGELARQRMLGLSPSPNIKDFEAKIDAAIDTFMRAYAR